METQRPTLTTENCLDRLKQRVTTSGLSKVFSLGQQELQKQFLERIEDASGKPVILQSDSTFHGHATIKLATKDQPAHLLLYKPEQESVLPYLVA